MTTTQAVLEHQQVVDIVHRLGRWLDGRGADPATIYAPDVVVQSPRGEVRGLEHVIDVAGPSDDPAERTTHQHTDLVVEVDGDDATVSAHQLVRFFRTGEAPWRTSGLWVEYRLERRPQGWRIAAARITLEWLAGRPLG